MGDEFNVDELHRLIDQVTTEQVQRPLSPPTNRVVSPTAGQRSLPFTLLNTGLIEKVYEVIHPYLNAADMQVVLDQLRQKLTEGLDTGNLQSLHAIINHCRKCPAMRPTPNLPYGNVADPDIVFVHEHTVRSEYIEQNYTDILAEAGLEARRVVHTSVVRCPTQEQRPLNVEEITNCNGYLLAEIQILQPKLVITLGSTAVESLINDKISITNDRGKIFWLGQWAILPTYAIGYAKRTDAARAALLSDLTYAAAFCYGR